jgi:hypothetical protein
MVKKLKRVEIAQLARMVKNLKRIEKAWFPVSGEPAMGSRSAHIIKDAGNLPKTAGPDLSPMFAEH